MLRFTALARLALEFGLLDDERSATELAMHFATSDSTEEDFVDWMVQSGTLNPADADLLRDEFDKSTLVCHGCGSHVTGRELAGNRRLRCPACRGTDLEFKVQLPDFDKFAREVSGDEWDLGQARMPKFGNWIGVEILGSGACGTVYKARNPVLGTSAAIKVLESTEDRVIRGFFKEARIAATLQHPNIVKVQDFGDSDGQPYIVMEFVDGKSMADLLDDRGTLPLGHLASLTRDVSAALSAAHAANIVHRDVKPENILLADGGRVLLADFGIAKVIEQSITVTGMVMGTPVFMSPEQITNPKSVGPATDVYALGALFFLALTGDVPFPADSATKSMHRAVNEPFPSLRAVAPEVPEDFDLLVQQMCAKDPTLRPSMREVHARLSEYADADLDSPAAVASSFPVPEERPESQSVAASGSDGQSNGSDGQERRPTEQSGIAWSYAQDVVDEYAPGDKIGNYVVVSRLGANRRSVLYRARHEGTDMVVDVRVMDSDEEPDRKELQALTRLSHRNVVRLWAHGRDRDHHYLVLEHIDGTTLADLLATRGRLRLIDALRLHIRVLEGLRAAHRLGITHRDIHPGCIALASDGRTVLGGFGLARFTSTSSESEATIHDVSAMETSLYKAPEQLEGPASPQSDIYAVGTCMYQAITGVLPFDGPPEVQLFARATADPVPIAQRLPEVDHEMDRIVLRLLSRDQKQRFATVDDVLKALAPLAR